MERLYPSTITAREYYTTGSVTSKDGTTIGYRQLGHGPGVVVLHGSMSTGQNHTQLAEALADTFTVYLPDRRGFGLSGPFGKDDSIQKDVEDLDALLTKTGAHNVFGVSAGGIICLEATLSLPAIHKLAIYEPPLFPNRAAPTALLKRLDQEIAQGKTGAAIATALKGAQMGSPTFNAMPHWLLALMMEKMTSYEVKQGSSDYVSFRELAPTLHHDGQLIVEMSGKQESLRAIRAEVLLLGGSKSSAFLKGALDGVEKVLPLARRIELPGLDHASCWNTDLRGQPQPVARELRRFFAEP